MPSATIPSQEDRFAASRSAALPLYGTGLAVMGFLGWRRKRRAQMA